MKKREIGQCKNCQYLDTKLYARTEKGKETYRIGNCLKDVEMEYPGAVKPNFGCWYWKEKK
jgi:hypothetical protein